MPYLTGLHIAGAAEATRLSQAIVHRGIEAATIAAAGERRDAARAGRLPEAHEGERVRDEPGRRPRGRRERGRRRGGEDRETGSLIDLQA
jgi:hypothetical protein